MVQLNILKKGLGLFWGFFVDFAFIHIMLTACYQINMCRWNGMSLVGRRPPYGLWAESQIQRMQTRKELKDRFVLVFLINIVWKTFHRRFVHVT